MSSAASTPHRRLLVHRILDFGRLPRREGARLSGGGWWAQEGWHTLIVSEEAREPPATHVSRFRPVAHLAARAAGVPARCPARAACVRTCARLLRASRRFFCRQQRTYLTGQFATGLPPAAVRRAAAFSLAVARAASSWEGRRAAMDPVTLDRWISELMECKPLTEQEVESLCEKVCACVRHTSPRLGDPQRCATSCLASRGHAPTGVQLSRPRMCARTAAACAHTRRARCSTRSPMCRPCAHL